LAGGSLLFLLACLVLAKVSPLEAGQTLVQGSLGSAAALTGTLRETTPLLIAGLAVFIALRAGLFNIGVEGQLTIGAFCCSVVALRLPGFLGIVVGLIAGMAGGALWALPAGWIKAYRNGHEVITTIMLNSVAVFLTTYLAAGPFKAPNQQEPSTEVLSDGSHLPVLLSIRALHINVGLVLGLMAVAVCTVWLSKTVSGFRFQATGANPVAARFAGVETKPTVMRAMLLSGALAGFGGAVQVCAYEFRFYEGFSPGYGFDALGVALLAGNSAVGVVPASLLFGILAKGGTALQIDGVPKGITVVVLGLLILIAAAIRYRKVNVVA